MALEGSKTDDSHGGVVRFLAKHPAAIALVAAAIGALAGGMVMFGVGRASKKEAPILRPAAVSVNATIFEKPGLVFAEREITKRYKGGYEEALTTFLLGSMSDSPLIRSYEKKGVLDAEKLSELRKDRDSIEQQLRETEVIFQVVATFSNSGDESATISKMEFSFPARRGDPRVEAFSDQPVVVDGNATKAKLYPLQIPLFLLLGEKLGKSARTLDFEDNDSPPRNEADLEQPEAIVNAKIADAPFINLRKNVQITAYDQNGREYRSEADFSKLLGLLDTQVPPEFKKRQESKDSSKSAPKAKK